MSSGRAWAFGLLWMLSACGGGAKQSPDGGVVPECTPVTCAAAGKACGTMADGCGRTLECGACPLGQTCGSENVCLAANPDGGSDGGASGAADGGADGGTTCAPKSCAELQKSCGAVPDGCGGVNACGSCPSGQVCAADNTCAALPPACVPSTCTALSKNCGALADGCGGTLECGSCTGKETCGGAGAANVCGAPPLKGGETRWVEFIDSGLDDAVQRVASDENGNLVVAGASGAFGSPPAIFLRKHGSDGKLTWEKRWAFGPYGSARFLGLAISPQGDIFFSVQTCDHSDCDGPDFGAGATMGGLLVKLDREGAFGWQVRPGLYIGHLAVDSSGNAAVISENYREYDAEVTKYDGAGARLWNYRTGYPGPLAFDANGNLVAFQTSRAGATNLLRFDPDGKVLWSKELHIYPRELGTTAIGTIVFLESEHLTVFEGEDGAQRFRIPLPISPLALTVDPKGRAAILGTDNQGCDDLAALYYALDGTLQWSRAIGAYGSCAGAPQARAVAIRAGDVVVGGEISYPVDFGTGVYTPQTQDGFLLDLAP